MDPQLQALAVQLTDTAVRNTAGAIADRITAAKARKKNEETIAELEEIVNGLVADKSELVRIAQAFEQELVSQRISPVDVEYITSEFVPVLRQLMESMAGDDDSRAAAQEMLRVIEPILSVETVTILQLIGFNFRKAVGEPLTTLVASAILSRAQIDPTQLAEFQQLAVKRDLAYLAVAQDAEAAARLATMTGQGG